MGALAMDMVLAMDMLDMDLATASMASVMRSPRLMLIPTTMVDMVLDMDMALAMDMVDMDLATASMASVMLSPRLTLILTTMVDMVDMDSMAIMDKLYHISSKYDVKFEMLPT